MAGSARPPLQANTCQLGAEAGPQSAGFVDKQHCHRPHPLVVQGGSPRLAPLALPFTREQQRPHPGCSVRTEWCPIFAETTGTLERLGDGVAHIRLEDGSERTLRIPEQIHVEEGMQVRLIDTGDDAPIVMWGI